MMFLVKPTALINSPRRASIILPGDKSISHRAVLLASIFEGVTILENISTGTDVLSTITAMQALGVSIDLDSITKKVSVTGVGRTGLKKPKNPIDCGNAGTLMRLLTGILAAQSFQSVLIGDESLSKRPMLRVAEPLRAMGADITLSLKNTAPIHIRGNIALHGIRWKAVVPSAQVKSAILLAGLYAKQETCVEEPLKTRDHTERMLHYFKTTDPARTLSIPGDFSAAAFFIVWAAITPNATLTLLNVGINPHRIGALDILKAMGASITIKNKRLQQEEPVGDIVVVYAPLQGIAIPEVCVASAIDEFPILFIAAACAKGKTSLSGAKELRVKESDRLSVMAENLKKMGVALEERPDGMTIEGGVLSGARLDAKGDHRVAMALAIAGTVAQGAVSIDNCEQVITSFPDFVETAKQVGIVIEQDKNNDTSDNH